MTYRTTLYEGGSSGGVGDAIDAHEAAPNPHPVYLTQAEADLLYALVGGGGGGLTQSQVMARGLGA